MNKGALALNWAENLLNCPRRRGRLETFRSFKERARTAPGNAQWEASAATCEGVKTSSDLLETRAWAAPRQSGSVWSAAITQWSHHEKKLS